MHTSMIFHILFKVTYFMEVSVYMLTGLIVLASAAIKELLFFVSYVANSSSFPQPLSPEEEQKYLELYLKGDQEAKNILVERNLRLVAHIVKKYGNIGREPDDLISIGTIGLIKAITTFDADKGTRLATYAARCIENAMLTNMLHFI